MIPARSGSKSIPNKNLSIVAGAPLIVRSILHALKTLPTCKPILSSDSVEYAEIALSYLSADRFSFQASTLEPGTISDFGTFSFHFRSGENASDAASLPSVLAEISDCLGAAAQPEAWLVLQPTTPFRNSDDFREWGQLCLKANPEISCISFKLVDDSHPARMYELLGDRMTPIGLYEGLEQAPRQQLPRVYLRDGGFYLIGKELVKSGLQFSSSPYFRLREFPWTINVDSPHDLLLATSLAASNASLRV